MEDGLKNDLIMRKITNEILNRINIEAELLGIDDTVSLNSVLYMINFVWPLLEKLYRFLVNYKFDSHSDQSSGVKRDQPFQC